MYARSTPCWRSIGNATAMYKKKCVTPLKAGQYIKYSCRYRFSAKHLCGDQSSNCQCVFAFFVFVKAYVHGSKIITNGQCFVINYCSLYINITDYLHIFRCKILSMYLYHRCFYDFCLFTLERFPPVKNICRMCPPNLRRLGIWVL